MRRLHERDNRLHEHIAPLTLNGRLPVTVNFGNLTLEEDVESVNPLPPPHKDILLAILSDF